MVLAIETHGSEITTIEGLSQDDRLHPLQEAFLQADAVEWRGTLAEIGL